MPSTASPLLKLELMATGENRGTWGTKANESVFTLIEDAIAGTTTITLDSTDYTLTDTEYAANEARAAIINMTGTLGASVNVICPTRSKAYIVSNATSGAFTVTFKTLAGTGVTITQGTKAIVYCDGTNVVSVIQYGSAVAAFLATPSSANLAAAVTGETGSGALVFATSPTLVTPVLGTPTSGTLTNCDGLPVATGISGLGAGVATFLATPSSANLAAAVTGETGSGALVFGTSPTIGTPTINGDAAGTLFGIDPGQIRPNWCRSSYPL